MNISSARFIDQNHSVVEAVIDGVVTQEVGGGSGDPRIREWIEQGNVPGAYVPPEPAVRTVIDGAEFLGRVSDLEYGAITASSDLHLRRWLDIFRLRGEIDVAGDMALAAKAGMVKLGLLTKQRAEEIFSPARDEKTSI